ncbi:MAG: hypothetical protein Q8R92_03220 [Deltaproteobacteria bacterium]|nr:hypothetical protein [Deltaproteobacteria bacterium]
MSDLLNVSIEVRDDADLSDLRALLRDRGASVITSRAAAAGRLEFLVVIEAEQVEGLADVLPAGATWRRTGVRGNLS